MWFRLRWVVVVVVVWFGLVVWGWSGVCLLCLLQYKECSISHATLSYGVLQSII